VQRGFRHRSGENTSAALWEIARWNGSFANGSGAPEPVLVQVAEDVRREHHALRRLALLLIDVGPGRGVPGPWP
jgi:hypothetical protein